MPHAHLTIGHTKSTLTGYIDDGVMLYIRSQISFAVEGAEIAKSQPVDFSSRESVQKALRLQQWDGRKYLISEVRREFQTGLVPRMMRLLKECRVDYSLYDNRNKNPQRQWTPIRLEYRMRDYQQQAIETAALHRMGVLRVGTGGGKCVAEDTLIWSKGLQTIQEAWGASQIASPFGTRKINGWWDDGINDGWRIETQSGNQIDGTDAHRVWIRKENGFEGWVLMKDIAVGDYIGLARGCADYGDYALSPEDAYVFGLILSDGYLRQQKNTATLQIDKQLPVLEKIRPIIAKWSIKNGGSGHVRIEEKSNYHAVLTVHGNWLVNFFQHTFGWQSSYSEDRYIPKIVLSAPQETLVALLRGMFDGDGWCDKHVSWSSASEKMAKQVHALLLGLGVYSKLSRKETTKLDAFIVRIWDLSLFDSIIGLTKYGLIKDCNYDALLSVHRNTNIDTIPGISSALEEGWAKINNKHLRPVWKDSRAYFRGERHPSYDKVQSWLNDADPGTFPTLERIVYENRAWSKIVLKQPSRIRRLDCEVDTDKSFVGNGIINHNTRIGLGIISKLERPTLFLVTQRSLMYQAADVFSSLLQYPDQLGLIGDGRFNPRYITIATIQSLSAALGLSVKKNDGETDAAITAAHQHRDLIEETIARAQLVIFDEVHHVAADTAYEIMGRCHNADYRFGLSATDWRDDGADLMIEAACGPRIVNIPLSELVARQVLVPAKIELHMMAEHEEKHYRGKEQYSSVYHFYYTKNRAFAYQVADINARWLNEGRTVLTLVTAVQHGKLLEELHHELGLPALFLSGTASSKTREKVLGDVREGRLRHLIATSIADEGLDLPVLDALNLAGGGKSSTRAYQRIGRVLRPSPGKQYGLVADYRCPDHTFFETQFRKRREIYTQERAFEIISA